MEAEINYPGFARQSPPERAERGRIPTSEDSPARYGKIGSQVERAKGPHPETLTSLYTDNPTWLQNIHARLDAAVNSAYGWEEELDDLEILMRLLKLNAERTSVK